MTLLIDTNVLIENPYFILDVEDDIIVPFTVLVELDKLKRNKDLNYAVRTAVKVLREYKRKYPDNISFSISEEEVSRFNDLIIIDSAIENGATLCTNDISMSVMGESKDLDVMVLSNRHADAYDPIVYIEKEDLPDTFSYKQLYKFSDALSDGITGDRTVDEWFFTMIHLGNNEAVVYANIVGKHLVRIDNNPTYDRIRSKKRRVDIKAFDLYQVMAIFLLKEAPNVLITGTFGSGKTLLSTAAVITQNNSKTFVGRVPSGVDKKYDIGYLPGSKDEKLVDYLQGVLSSMYFIFGNTSNQSPGKKAEVNFDFVKEELFSKYFHIMNLNTIQGLSLASDYLLIDEVQYLTVDAMSAILSRSSDYSKTIMIGDLKQSHSMTASNSGLLKLIDNLPDPSIGFIDLPFTHRGGLSNIAAKLMTDIL